MVLLFFQSSSGNKNLFMFFFFLACVKRIRKRGKWFRLQQICSVRRSSQVRSLHLSLDSFSIFACVSFISLTINLSQRRPRLHICPLKTLWLLFSFFLPAQRSGRRRPCAGGRWWWGGRLSKRRVHMKRERGLLLLSNCLMQKRNVDSPPSEGFRHASGKSIQSEFSRAANAELRRRRHRRLLPSIEASLERV